MPPTAVISGKKPTIVELADKIEKDIRARGLKSGDAYIGQAETKRMLRVGTDAANRALQLLSQRGVLVRRQRKGTFVGNLDSVTKECPIRRVHIVVPEEFLKIEGFFADERILGIQGELPRAEIVINFLPEINESQFVQDLVNEATGMRGVHAFILASSTFTTQQIMAASGLPTVIGGSLYPSIVGLSCIDDDHQQAAKLTAEYLIGRGCRQFLLLARQRTLPGEQVFIDALTQELGAQGVGCGDVVVRRLSSVADEIKGAIAAALAGCHGKVGIVARTEPIARAVEELVVASGLQVGSNFEMVGANFHDMRRETPFVYPVLQGMKAPREQGQLFGALLKQFATQKPARSCQFPVELALPK